MDNTISVLEKSTEKGKFRQEKKKKKTLSSLDLGSCEGNDTPIFFNSKT